MNTFLIYLFILMVLITVSAYLAINLEDLVGAVIAFSSMSLGLSITFYLLEAPDVAIAEAAVGAGLTTAIYLMAIRKTERWEK